ncbi:DUF3624 domain-containing protein [uncultured Vibrio sp.]|uniref:DUF3624 domain-containing protein n=1 Tax=uncultured Vibrio sp. TaxID=114054 RepID=UPI0009192244|nr:DUF3624 domain-containing protein [uncultured Vibrio sp.]OIQ25391.1 MAG: hypothetical protein BM561_06405 [Vibrio sp. MedPE-SWchi]
MTCKTCENSGWFWKKIGRCQRCMDQLTTLSVVCGVVWWFTCRDDPSSIESITLIVASFAFNGLLFLHLWMKFIVLPFKENKGNNKETHRGEREQDKKNSSTSGKH